MARLPLKPSAGMPLADAVLFCLWALVAANILHDVYYLAASYPNGYNWGEMFIKYTDGVVRRGLWGTLLYPVAHVVPIGVFWVAAALLVTLFVLKRAYALFAGSFSPYFTTLLFFAPGGVAFLVYAWEMFGRKDILFFPLALGMFWCARQGLCGALRPGLALAGGAACMGLAILGQETFLVFLGLPALLLARMYGGLSPRNPALYVLAAVFALGALFAAQHVGTQAMQDAMFRHWQELVPGFVTRGGMRFVGADLSRHASFTLPYYQNHEMLLSLIRAWLLALLPLGLLLRAYRYHEICVAVLGRGLALLVYPAAFLPAVVLMCIINDFGRVIAFTTILFAFFSASLFQVYKRTVSAVLPTRPLFDRLTLDAPLVACATLCYLLGWKLLHYAPLEADPSIITSAF